MKKYFISTIIFLTVCNIVNSQTETPSTYEIYRTKFVDYFYAENYDSAFVYAEKCLYQAEADSGKICLNYSRALNNIGLVYEKFENYKKAEECYLQAIDIVSEEKLNNRKYFDIYLKNLKNIRESSEIYLKAKDYYNKLDFKNAAELFEKNLQSYDKEIFKNDTTNYVDILHYTAYCFSKIKNYEKAEYYYLEAINVYNNADKYSKSYKLADLLNNVGVINDNSNNFESAKEYYYKALEIYIDIYPKNSEEYKSTLDNLSALIESTEDFKSGLEYYNSKNYDKAVKQFEKCLIHYDIKYFQNDTIYYTYFLNLLAYSYQVNMNFERAEFYYLKLINVYYSAEPDCKSETLVKIFNNLGVIYRDIGNYNTALEYFFKAMDLRKNLNDEFYCVLLESLGGTYYLSGNYEKAEEYLLNSLEIKKRIYGDKNEKNAVTLNSLALLYSDLGNYEKAKAYFLIALEISKELNNENYAILLTNLGALFYELNEFKKSEEYYLKSLEIIKNLSGEVSMSYSYVLNALAFLYCFSGEYNKSEEYYIESLEIKKELFGEKSNEYAVVLNNLGLLYLIKGEYQKAEENALKTLEIQKELLGEKHSSVAKTLNHLGFVYSFTNNFEKAEEYRIAYNENLNNQISANFNFLTEKEKEKFINQIDIGFDIINSFIFDYQKPELYEIAYNNELSHKGMILNSTNAFKKEILNSKDTLVQIINSELLNTKQTLSKLYSLPKDERFLPIDSLEEIANNLEKQLYVNFPSFENLESFNSKWTDVQNSLKENEAAIEFTNFVYIPGLVTDSIFYCALVLTKEMKNPELVFLFEEKQLDTLLYKDEFADEYKYIKKLYSFKEFGDSIYNIVWQPFDSLLTDIKTVYISPSGILNKIAFDAIPNSEKTLLSDKYEIKYVSSTANIINQKEYYSSEIENIALFGDINYDINTTEMQQIAEKLKSEKETSVARSLDYLSESISRGGVWQYLSGTKIETNEIKNIFEKNNFSTTLYTQNLASEEQFKSFSNNSLSLIHIATHGFYFPNVESNKETFAFMENEIQYVFSENPLLRSGIILSGGNNIWSDIEIPENVEDGVLSAYEISQMNLFGTKLVVLSACQTGLGDVKGSEGVFGLRRALKMAGVEYIIMSLWSVPDEQTKELMTEFYKNFVSGKEIHEAFKLAQNYMKEKYKDVAGAAYAWAAFVLIE